MAEGFANLHVRVRCPLSLPDGVRCGFDAGHEGIPCNARISTDAPWYAGDPKPGKRPPRVHSTLPVRNLHVVAIGDDPTHIKVFVNKRDAMAEIRNLWVNERVPARWYKYERVDEGRRRGAGERTKLH